jgi:Binding-protein-dependent transport system inner membrane component
MQVFAKVQFSAALPFIFSGAKVAVTLAVIGAVIGEFVGSVGGLGNLLLTANSQLDSALAWAALIWLSILGILAGGRASAALAHAMGRRRTWLLAAPRLWSARDEIDFDARALGQARHADAGSRRPLVCWKVGGIDLVHGLEFAHIDDKDAS